MKNKTISHGSRHRPSWGKRQYRELTHSDDETLSRGREEERDLEPEEWPWQPPCRCCNFDYEFDDKLRLILSARKAATPFAALQAHGDRLSREGTLADEGSGISALADSEGTDTEDTEDTDAFLDELQSHLVEMYGK